MFRMFKEYRSMSRKEKLIVKRNILAIISLFMLISGFIVMYIVAAIDDHETLVLHQYTPFSVLAGRLLAGLSISVLGFLGLKYLSWSE